ncbi:MAG: DUF523 domain-containing protein [Syntrophaceae bacterium]|nr:DUF523 domain-containing protein [Syntrophaceae bacterium]
MIIASACLLGLKCRWDGRIYPQEKQLINLPDLIAVCPEQLGGLATPREPARIINGNGFDVLDNRARVINASGVDVTGEFIRGARAVLEIARKYNVDQVVLKERSPSCGVHCIYQGKTLAAGMGVTCALLLREGITILSSEEIGKLHA